MKTKHRTIDELLIYLESPIGAKEDENIEAHLAECDECVSDLHLIDLLRIGIKEFGKHSQSLIVSGKSPHIMNEEISGYISESCSEDEKRMIVTHLAGCGRCLNDVFAIMKLKNQMEQESSLIKQGYLIYQFIRNHPARITSIEKEAKGLLRSAAKFLALPGIERALSMSFQGTESNETGLYKKPAIYDKFDEFVIEVTETQSKPPKVIIGIMARKDFKQAKIIIYLKDEQKKGLTEMVPLHQRNAIVHKEGIRTEDILGIEVQGYTL